jgi:hypothetical protein
MNTDSNTQKAQNKGSEHGKNDQGRTEYLINFRNGLWEAIRHKENGIWQFISLFAAALVVVIGLIQDGKFLGAINVTSISFLNLIILFVTFWGVIIILDANFWLSRNLWFISNIEWEFLGHNGIGTIIPAYYSTPNFRYSRLYSVHLQILLALTGFLVLAEGALIFSKKGVLITGEKIVVGILVFILSFLLCFLIQRDRQWVKDYYGVRSGAPGVRQDFQNYSDYYRVKSEWNSPITRWVYILSLLEALVFIIVAVKILFVFSNPFRYISSILVFLLIMILGPYLYDRFYLRKKIKLCQTLIREGIDEHQLVSNNSFILLQRSSRALNLIIYGTQIIINIFWVIILLQSICVWGNTATI